MLFRMRRATEGEGQGRDGSNSPLTSVIVNQINTANCDEHFCFGTGRRRFGWN